MSPMNKACVLNMSKEEKTQQTLSIHKIHMEHKLYTMTSLLYSMVMPAWTFTLEAQLTAAHEVHLEADIEYKLLCLPTGENNMEATETFWPLDFHAEASCLAVVTTPSGNTSAA